MRWTNIQVNHAKNALEAEMRQVDHRLSFSDRGHRALIVIFEFLCAVSRAIPV